MSSIPDALFVFCHLIFDPISCNVDGTMFPLSSTITLVGPGDCSLKEDSTLTYFTFTNYDRLVFAFTKGGFGLIHTPQTLDYFVGLWQVGDAVFNFL